MGTADAVPIFFGEKLSISMLTWPDIGYTGKYFMSILEAKE